MIGRAIKVAPTVAIARYGHFGTWAGAASEAVLLLNPEPGGPEGLPHFHQAAGREAEGAPLFTVLSNLAIRPPPRSDVRKCSVRA